MYWTVASRTVVLLVMFHIVSSLVLRTSWVCRAYFSIYVFCKVLVLMWQLCTLVACGHLVPCWLVGMPWNFGYCYVSSFLGINCTWQHHCLQRYCWGTSVWFVVYSLCDLPSVHPLAFLLLSNFSFKTLDTLKPFSSLHATCLLFLWAVQPLVCGAGLIP